MGKEQTHNAAAVGTRNDGEDETKREGKANVVGRKTKETVRSSSSSTYLTKGHNTTTGLVYYVERVRNEE